MNQVCEQRDAAAGEEDRQLGERRGAQHREREPDRDQALSRALDARIDQTVRVAVLSVMVATVVDVGPVVMVGVGELAPVTMEVAAQMLVGRCA